MESIVAHFDLNLVGLLWHSANFVLLLAARWWLFFRPITRRPRLSLWPRLRFRLRDEMDTRLPNRAVVAITSAAITGLLFAVYQCERRRSRTLSSAHVDRRGLAFEKEG